ncbi:MAG: DUF1841 family protein [Proteobacteria bacterium]|nr:DUF1841 family protein [Pseudomonadota bacterium]
MDTYDPLVAPDPDEWLSLDEQERLILVEDHHSEAGVELPNEMLHAVLHSIVENQVAEGDEIPIGATLDRLVAEGLDRHEAIHAIGGVLAEFMFDLIGGGEPAADGNEKYYRQLEILTAAGWLESFD